MTITDLFAHQGLQPEGPTKWRERVPCALPGVYVVTLDPNPLTNTGLPPALHHRWLTDQPILYIGKAGGPQFKSTLRKRVRQFYRHKYGEARPHSGGQAVQLLVRAQLPLWLFWAPILPPQDPRTVECRMIAAFKAEAGVWPFANGQD